MIEIIKLRPSGGIDNNSMAAAWLKPLVLKNKYKTKSSSGFYLNPSSLKSGNILSYPFEVERFRLATDPWESPTSSALFDQELLKKSQEASPSKLKQKMEFLVARKNCLLTIAPLAVRSHSLRARSKTLSINSKRRDISNDGKLAYIDSLYFRDQFYFYYPALDRNASWKRSSSKTSRRGSTSNQDLSTQVTPYGEKRRLVKKSRSLDAGKVSRAFRPNSSQRNSRKMSPLHSNGLQRLFRKRKTNLVLLSLPPRPHSNFPNRLVSR